MPSSSPIFRFVTSHLRSIDPRSVGFVSNAHALGIPGVERIDCADLYFIQGNLDDAQLDLLARRILGDPVTQHVEWTQAAAGTTQPTPLPPHTQRIEVALRPGVTDPVAEQIVRAARELGLRGLRNASTGQRFTITGSLTEAGLHLLASRLLANPVIQRYAIGEIEPVFPTEAQASGRVEMIPIRGLDDGGLLACSAERRAALDLAEMRAIRAYFTTQGRDCTDVEFEMIAQTWSEHCVHKTFKACIEVQTSPDSPDSARGTGPDSARGTGPDSARGTGPYPAGGAGPYPARVDGLLNTYIRRATQEIAAPWVISAFNDNAGIIAFGAEHEISFKVETHNHPSAIEPFGGANTGVGGVIRDVLGVSARPIAATDILCFGPQDTPPDDLPAGVLHPRRILSGVVAGVQDYGNKMGIPTVNGALWFDPGYTANPLVYCGCVGLAPRGLHRHTPEPGDHVIVLGGRTGRDGLRGATFSSMAMDAQTGEVSGASVQIGAPITEKVVMEVLLQARDRGLYTAVTDCGAGGLSSAVGELASHTGADVDLSAAPLKYSGLAPWEIWLSEAQERMVIAVPPEHLDELQSLCDLFDVELTDLGTFTGDGCLVVRYHGDPVLRLDADFLHKGLPQRHLQAVPPPPAPPPPTAASLPDPAAALLRLLAHPNVASKEAVIRIYDHEVQGGTCVKPLTGPGGGPSDACVLKPAGTPGVEGIVLSNGFNPEYGKVNAYRMALCVVDEAVRNAVATGADPDHLALLDNFCWGDPLRPETMWSLLEAARGCYEAAVAHRAPFISGKDSLNNEYLTQSGARQAIPPSLLISAVATIPDVCRAMTMEFKQGGSALYLVGEFQPAFGGSHFASCFGLPRDVDADTPLPGAQTPALYRALHRAMQEPPKVVLACHDMSEGGLSAAAAEMCIAAGLGLALDLPSVEDLHAWLFGETAGCLLVEVAAGWEAEFERSMNGLPYRRLGRVQAQPTLTVHYAGQLALSLPVSDLAGAWRTPLA